MIAKIALTVIAVYMTFAFVAVSLSHAGREGTLEVRLVERTPDGPQLTINDGCYIYGAFVATLEDGKRKGIIKTHYILLVRDYKGPNAVEGMQQVLFQTIDVVYSYGPTSEALTKVQQDAIDFCRARGGKTWLFWQKT